MDFNYYFNSILHLDAQWWHTVTLHSHGNMSSHCPHKSNPLLLRHTPIPHISDISTTAIRFSWLEK